MQSSLQQGHQLPSLTLGKTKYSQRSGEAFWWKKGKAVAVPNWRLLHAQTVGRLMRNGVSYVTGQGNISGHLQLVLNQKQGQKVEKLAVINQVLVVWGQLLQELSFGFLDWLLYTTGPSCIFKNGLIIVCLYITNAKDYNSL